MELTLGSLRTLIAVIRDGVASTPTALPATNRVALVLSHLPDHVIRHIADAGCLLMGAVFTAYRKRIPGQDWRPSDDVLTLDRVAELGQALADAFATTPEAATLQDRVTAALETMPTPMIGELGDATSRLNRLTMARLGGPPYP